MGHICAADLAVSGVVALPSPRSEKTCSWVIMIINTAYENAYMCVQTQA